jgi:hypothetical protein
MVETHAGIMAKTTEETVTTEATVTTIIIGCCAADASKSIEAIIAGEAYAGIYSEKLKGVLHAKKWAKVSITNDKYTTTKEDAVKSGSQILTAMATKLNSQIATIQDGLITIAHMTKIFSFNAKIMARGLTITQNRD